MTTSEAPRPRAAMRIVYLLPLVLFAALAAVFLIRLESGENPDAIPSALVGKPAPAFDLPALAGVGVPGITRADLDGKVTLVNVFASWCVPCRQEHPVLEALAKDPTVRIVGINYKDDPANALKFLTGLGNPYAAIGVDPRGRAAIDWGVYGVPETFLVGPDGVIRHKVIGPISAEIAEKELKPAIAKLATP